MSDDDRYPDVPIDATGLDALVRTLSEMDESHEKKALALIMAARTEYRYAVADGADHLPDPFAAFAATAEEKTEEAIAARQEAADE